VADLGQFGETNCFKYRASIPVIAVEDQDTMVGLAVDKIVGMEWLDVEKCRCWRMFRTAAPFLRVWLLDKQTHQRLQLLDPKGILREVGSMKSRQAEAVHGIKQLRPGISRGSKAYIQGNYEEAATITG